MPVSGRAEDVFHGTDDDLSLLAAGCWLLAVMQPRENCHVLRIRHDGGNSTLPRTEPMVECRSATAGPPATMFRQRRVDTTNDDGQEQPSTTEP